MKRSIINAVTAFGLGAFILLIIQGCHQSQSVPAISDSLSARRAMPPSAVLSPEESLKKMHVADGFNVQLVAAEPFVVAPVAMNFDNNGRIWVVEMENYMPDTVGSGEDIPGSKIVILSDTNNDGVIDHRKVFIDSLVLPRALCLIENGILVAESPKLWYYEIVDDKPGKRTLVDSAYAEGGNVEHQPNALFRALDNWIYNAKSGKRYRKRGNKWLIERTHFRGQWGITQDDQGRLYYNTNTENLLGDYFSPGLGGRNKNQKSVAGFNETIIADNKVYPARPTPGVNRGYMKGILDDSLRLVEFTAACAPLIYNGDLFGKEYYGNAFVAEPSANLIKRNILSDSGYATGGRQAYSGKEFIASEDERFRPVNLLNGPDGALYIIDMYRGIIQHKTYLTPYLKNEIASRSLTAPLSCGRIYRVVPNGRQIQRQHISSDPNDLPGLLRSNNGWLSARAQQLLVDSKDQQLAPALRKMLNEPNNSSIAVRALWTMEGLGVLLDGDVLPLLKSADWNLRMQALSVLPGILSKENYRQFLPVLEKLISDRDTLAAPYIGFIANSFRPFDSNISEKFLAELAKTYPNNIFVADAIISNLEGREGTFYKKTRAVVPDTNLIINKRLNGILAYIEKSKSNSNIAKLEKDYPRGVALFRTVCQTCHGADGNGVSSLAPPFNGSEWVQGDKTKLISIVLFGLAGPVRVAGKLYRAPEINGEMPGLVSNDEVSDEQIAQVLSFIRQAWGNHSGPVLAAEVSQVRKSNLSRVKAFTAEELNNKPR